MNKKKKGTINPTNDDDKCFQYAIAIVLNHKKLELHPQRVINIKLFIKKYNWEGINYPPKIEGWKRFEKKKNKKPDYYSQCFVY